MSLEPLLQNPLDLALFVIFAGAFAGQLFYYFYFFLRLMLYKPEHGEGASEPVSVIICAKDEEQNLQENLPLIMEQDYPDFEVIVVNDRSEDNTEHILKQFANNYEHLKIVTISSEADYVKAKGKKFALTLGIKRAQHDILLLTDADCKPKSKHWISQVQQAYTSETDIVLGYGAYEKQNGFLNRLIRFDTFFVALQYLTYALAGLTYMGVGRNLSYRKHLFFDNKGFGSHNQLMSGDDDLFINEVAEKAKVKLEIKPEAHTVSKPKSTFRNWFRQKRRHLTTGPHYKWKHKFFLGFFMMSQILFYGVFFTLLSIQMAVSLVLILFVIRLIVQLLVFRGVMKHLQEEDLLLFSPMLDLLLTVINLIVACSNLITRPSKWT